MRQTDVLIVGSGVAGLATALTLAKAGLQVCVISSGKQARHSESSVDHEGLAYIGDSDSPEVFVKDLVEASKGQCNVRAVEHLASKGPSLVDEFLVGELGIAFDRDDSGKWSLSSEEGHSCPRTLRHRDTTGACIIDAMLSKLGEYSHVSLLEDHTAIDLITLAQHSTKSADLYRKPACCGAYVLDNKTLTVEPILAKETVLATGGMGQIFLHSLSRYNSQGDGLAMASRAGARIMNLQSLQFHPLAFFLPNKPRCRIPDGIRHHGGELLSAMGASFMEKYHEKATSAPSSVVARAAYSEIVEKGVDHLWLNATPCDSAYVQENFPQLKKSCQEGGFDIGRNHIPVVPVFQCCNGGVFVDTAGQTTIHRLRAVGEVACTGVHGQQRLSSVSLLERLVWGVSCAEDIRKEVKKFAYYMPEVFPWPSAKQDSDPTLISQDWAAIKQTMWSYVGAVTNTPRAARAKVILEELQSHAEADFNSVKPTRELVTLRNGIASALLVASAVTD